MMRTTMVLVLALSMIGFGLLASAPTVDATGCDNDEIGVWNEHVGFCCRLATPYSECRYNPPGR